MSAAARKQRSLTEKIFSLETMLGLIGLGLLAGGIQRGNVMAMFWGGITLGGLTILYLVRKKDWQKHWAELEQRDSNRKQ